MMKELWLQDVLIYCIHCLSSKGHNSSRYLQNKIIFLHVHRHTCMLLFISARFGENPLDARRRKSCDDKILQYTVYFFKFKGPFLLQISTEQNYFPSCTPARVSGNSLNGVEIVAMTTRLFGQVDGQMDGEETLSPCRYVHCSLGDFMRLDEADQEFLVAFT